LVLFLSTGHGGEGEDEDGKDAAASPCSKQHHKVHAQEVLWSCVLLVDVVADAVFFQGSTPMGDFCRHHCPAPASYGRLAALLQEI
jgi:hypothetical protein